MSKKFKVTTDSRGRSCLWFGAASGQPWTDGVILLTGRDDNAVETGSGSRHTDTREGLNILAAMGNEYIAKQVAEVTKEDANPPLLQPVKLPWQIWNTAAIGEVVIIDPDGFRGEPEDKLYTLDEFLERRQICTCQGYKFSTRSDLDDPYRRFREFVREAQAEALFQAAEEIDAMWHPNLKNAILKRAKNLKEGTPI